MITSRPNTRRTLRGVALAAATLAALAAFSTNAGCRGDRSKSPPRQFFPDMDDQPKYKAQVKSTFFQEFDAEERYADRWGRASRLPVENTVPFGDWALTDPVMDVDFARRDDLLRVDPVVYEGRNADGTVVEDIPIPVDEALLALGEKKYNIYCIACHGGTGAGDGLVGRSWVVPIPSYHSEQYLKGAEGTQSPDGHLFDVIRNGVKNDPIPNTGQVYRMRPYGSKVSAKEAWAIVAYIRALQMTRRGTLDLLNDADRTRLIEQRNRALSDVTTNQRIADANSSNGAAQ